MEILPDTCVPQLCLGPSLGNNFDTNRESEPVVYSWTQFRRDGGGV